MRDGCVQLCPLRNKERLFVYQGLYLLPLPVVFGNPCQIFPALVVEKFLTGFLFVSRGNSLLLLVLVQLSAGGLLSFVMDAACIVGIAVSVLPVEEILVFLVREYGFQNVLEHFELSVVLFMSGHLRLADRGSVSADVRIPVPGNDQNALQKGPAVQGAECFRNVIFLGFQNLCSLFETGVDVVCVEVQLHVAVFRLAEERLAVQRTASDGGRNLVGHLCSAVLQKLLEDVLLFRFRLFRIVGRRVRILVFVRRLADQNRHKLRLLHHAVNLLVLAEELEYGLKVVRNVIVQTVAGYALVEEVSRVLDD